MKRLDRYLAAEMLWPFATTLLFLFGLLMAMQLLKGIEVMLGSAVTVLDVLAVAGCMAPHFVAMAMPVSFLFAVMLALGRLAEDRETVAMAASGVPPWRLAVAPLALSLCLAAVGVLLGRGPEPRGLSALRLRVNELIKKNMAGDVKPGVFYDAIDNVTLYAQSVAPRTRRFENVLLADERDPEASLLVLARRGYIDPQGGGGSLAMVLDDGEIHRAGQGGDDYAVAGFERGSINFDVGGNVIVSRGQMRLPPREEMTPGDLYQAEQRALAEGSERTARSLRFTRVKRVAAPLATVAFALCGVPLALGRRRASRALGAMATLAIYVGYYVLARAAELRAESGVLDPTLAAFAPAAAFLGLAAVLVRRASRAEA